MMVRCADCANLTILDLDRMSISDFAEYLTMDTEARVGKRGPTARQGKAMQCRS